MKANHNNNLKQPYTSWVGLNISNSKNESKSQHYDNIPSILSRWVKYQ
ncbi:hypothetical protein GO621_09475 [Mucilaginibacter sp. HMF7410]|uniref:Uncharacterized protein n=1 Tax=Mucilaginibacter arboris TaxID=2682090 RepID=A0A7K1SWR9_9SPHI|nr:hypothetical protein [Mucilaginibacter arboris]MVN21766.1 hypothetical protein [Mucilaginibacter arboris]